MAGLKRIAYDKVIASTSLADQAPALMATVRHNNALRAAPLCCAARATIQPTVAEPFVPISAWICRRAMMTLAIAFILVKSVTASSPTAVELLTTGMSALIPQPTHVADIVPTNAAHQTSASSVDSQCGIWLAPSTIEGAGIGMFAGVDFAEGQDLILGGDSVIAISDLALHNTNKGFKETFVWEEYTWIGRSLNMGYEGYESVEAASEGFGAAVNCFMGLVNVNGRTPTLTDLGLHRSKDPGAGASTQFHQRKAVAKHPIAAGAELFVSCTWLAWYYRTDRQTVRSHLFHRRRR
jgi:hypothetical protein